LGTVVDPLVVSTKGTPHERTRLAPRGKVPVVHLGFVVHAIP
jgi:hypothetical protein